MYCDLAVERGLDAFDECGFPACSLSRRPDDAGELIDLNSPMSHKSGGSR